MPKSKIKLQHGGIKMMIPMYRFKTFQHLKEEVEQRFNLNVNGFVIDNFHISYNDEIGEILENSANEVIEVLSQRCRDQKRVPPFGECQPDWGGIQLKRSGKVNVDLRKRYKALDLESVMTLFERVTKLEARLKEYERLNPWLVESPKVDRVLDSSNCNSQDAGKLCVQSSTKSIHVGDMNKMTKSSSSSQPNTPKGSSNHDKQSEQEKNHVRTTEPVLKKTKPEPKIQNRKSQQNRNLSNSELSLWKCKSEPKKESPHKTQRYSSDDEPKRTPRPTKANTKNTDHWAIVERNMAERRKKRLRAEQASRASKDHSRRKSFTSTNGITSGTVNRNTKTSISRKMRQKVEQLTNRKGGRGEVKRDRETQFGSNISLEEKTADLTRDGLATASSRKSPIKTRVSKRIKQRKGLCFSDRWTVSRPKTEFIQVAKQQNPPEYHTKNTKPIFIDGNMSKKEASRIERMKLEIGDKVEISGHREGVLKFIGETAFSKGNIFGIELLNGSLGENSGIIDGVSYFNCRENRGVFIASTNLRRKCRKVKVEPRRSVYRRRIVSIFEQLNPNKLKNVDHLLDKYEGKEHMLYSNVCKKYLVSPEQEYKETMEV